MFDTLFMAGNIRVVYSNEPPREGPWLLYGNDAAPSWALEHCLIISHCPDAWSFLENRSGINAITKIDGIVTLFPERGCINVDEARHISFDIIANAFYFLTSWAERTVSHSTSSRQLYVSSIFKRFEIPQDIVDQYLDHLMYRLGAILDGLGEPRRGRRLWPSGAAYALVISHDVDFMPHGLGDILLQGAKSVLRHIVHQWDPIDAICAARGLARALASGCDPYGDVPGIIAREQAAGVRASFQVAVKHRHPADVNYRIEDDRIRNRLRAITDAGFDLCLHGSYRSTEKRSWYHEEVELLAAKLSRPFGSRQHFLSFDYDVLFSAQETSGIQYDMSMGFPDRIGSRTGFSYPYFPFCIGEDRCYNVVELGLSLMDVTLRWYMNLKGERAWQAIEGQLKLLSRRNACTSAVWHPIVFGGARDPGYDNLFWKMVRHVTESGGIATDGRTINDFWRREASNYVSFG